MQESSNEIFSILSMVCLFHQLFWSRPAGWYICMCSAIGLFTAFCWEQWLTFFILFSFLDFKSSAYLCPVNWFQISNVGSMMTVTSCDSIWIYDGYLRPSEESLCLVLRPAVRGQLCPQDGNKSWHAVVLLTHSGQEQSEHLREHTRTTHVVIQ